VIAMSIQTTCPSCGMTATTPDTLRGKKVNCKRCASPFVIGSQAQLHEELEPRQTLRPTPPKPTQRAMKGPLIPPLADGTPAKPVPSVLQRELKDAKTFLIVMLIGVTVFTLIAVALGGAVFLPKLFGK